MNEEMKSLGQSIIPENTNRDLRCKIDRVDKVAELSPRQIQICKLRAQGLGNKEIALLTGVTAQNVSDVVNSEKGKALINDFLSFTIGKAATDTAPIESIIGDAQKIVKQIVDPTNLEKGAFPLQLVVRTALEVTKKSIPSTINVNRNEQAELGSKVIERIKERSALAQAVRNGDIEDANFEEIE